MLIKSTVSSHDSQKDRFVIFVRGAPKLGKKSRMETLGTIGVVVQSLSDQNFKNLTYGRTSKGPNPEFGRTPERITTWLRDGQKGRFLIFGHGALKMGKKS